MTVAEATSELIVILLALKRGDCWCEVGIGNPMARDNSPACKQVQAFIAGQTRCRCGHPLARHAHSPTTGGTRCIDCDCSKFAAHSTTPLADGGETHVSKA